MGAFTYCEEDDTFAALYLDDDIPQETKQERLDKLMEIQQNVAADLNEKMVGSIQKVLIDRVENGVAYGRTQYDSPEVDPEVIISNASVEPGQFVDVRIIEAYPFELVGVIE